MNRRFLLPVVLAILLLISVCVNSQLLFRLTAAPDVVGTYCDHNSNIYIILDAQGRYCRYQPPATVFEVGTYKQITEQQYELYDGEPSSQRFSALLFQEVLFFVDHTGTVMELEKVADIPVYNTVPVLLEP